MPVCRQSSLKAATAYLVAQHRNDQQRAQHQQVHQVQPLDTHGRSRGRAELFRGPGQPRLPLLLLLLLLLPLPWLLLPGLCRRRRHDPCDTKLIGSTSRNPLDQPGRTI